MIIEEITNIFCEKILPVIIVNGVTGWGETLITEFDNINKRREVGFGVLESIKGGTDETIRKLVADFKGEEFTPDRKAIEFLD